MRKYLLSAAAALAIATPAAAETSGYVDAGFESSELDRSTGSADEFDALHLGGAVHHDFGNGWGLQADGRTVSQSYDGASIDDSHGYAAVHAYTGLSDHWDLGGYVGLIDVFGFSGHMAGIESRKHIGSLSLQGSVNYADIDASHIAWDYRISADWFFTPNFAVNAGIGATDWDYDSGFDAESNDWSVGAAYQFGGGFALYGSYNDTHTDWVSYDYDVETFRIGVRWHFNGGDKQRRTKARAGMERPHSMSSMCASISRSHWRRAQRGRASMHSLGGLSAGSAQN
jgi:hypothetical protein